MLSDLMNRADVGMIQCGSGACFAAKAFECLRISGYILWQEFQGDKLPKLGALGFIHDAHTIAAEPLNDAVVLWFCRLPANPKNGHVN
jgi:hypothetical protein